MTFIDYLNIVLRHKWMLIVSTVLCTLLGIAACFIIPPVYESNGKLLISQDNMSLIGNGSSPLEDIMLSSLGKSDPLTTQMEILKTRPIMNRVIDSLGLKGVEGVLLPEDLLKRFSFSLVRNTNLIEVKCKSHSNDTATLLVNVLMQVFVEKNQQMNQEMISTAKYFIKNQLVEQKIKVEESEQKLVAYKEKTKVMSLDKETEVNIAAYSNLNVELIKVTGELNAALNQQKFYKEKLGNKNSFNDPMYATWTASTEQIDNVIAGLNAKRDALEKQLSIQKGLMKDAPVIEAQLISLLREQRIANEIYTGLLSKFEEYKVQEAAKIGSAKIIEPAVPTIKPVFPKKRVIVLLAFLLGLSIGLTTVFGVYSLKGIPNSIEEVKKAVGDSILGTIPYQNKLKSALFTRDCPDSVSAEAIRLTQTNIKLRLPDRDKGVIVLVTSTQPGEGKSTISANLAYSYSSSVSTVLLNMDFRRPSFKKIFGDTIQEIGLVEGVVEGVDSYAALSRYIQRVGSLDVLNSGAIYPNPLDIVQSHAMKKLLDILREKYKLIIIDSAPITLVAETIELVKSSDIVMVVADILSVRLKNLYNLKTILQGVNKGVVVNKAFKSSSGYYDSYRAYK